MLPTSTAASAPPDDVRDHLSGSAKDELLLALKLNSEADEYDPGINEGIATFMTNVPTITLDEGGSSAS